ncbi:MAG: HD domain-containing protein [Spirochaetales bacterium]|nr:HD domain-containing protein [Spirochaetales bacterium]
MKNPEKILNYLDREFTDAVRDPVWGHIYLSPFLRRLTQTKDFSKLNGIRQLGPSIHVYPGATHTRYNHSLGVYHIAGKLIRLLVQHPECPPLTLTGVKSFLNAALLHDLGHFPYTHSLKELPLTDHEQLSGRIIREGALGKLIDGDGENSSLLTAAIVDEEMPVTGFGEEAAFYRSLLSGVLDPDKLDYLNRDAFFCGVPYGIQDTEFVLSQIIPTREGIAISDKGSLAVENILFSKYLMYKAVYWHRDVRISTALVKKALYLALNRGELKGEDLYGLTDADFHLKVKELSPALSSLIESSENPLSYAAVIEKDFKQEDPLHRKLENLEERTAYEGELAEKLKKRGMDIDGEEIIVDVPEKISFEVDLPVLREGRYIPFTSLGTLFSAPSAANLTGVLRKVRLLLPRDRTDKLKPEEIVQIAQI